MRPVARLRRSDWRAGGIRRVGRGKGFTYRWWSGERVDDPVTLERIRQLAIPPAWRDVWICPWPNGHIQATGTDAAGRRQYRYHDAWREHRDREKFERVLALGRSMDALRARVADDLGGSGLGRARVLAAVVRLLDLGCFRVGGEEYAAEHETFGIATLRQSHAKVRGGALLFSFPAKGSKWQEIVVHEPDVEPVVASLVRRRTGPDDLFCYRDGGRWVDVRSADVNAYIKEAAGDDYSAKDFRTWSATVLAATLLAGVDPPPASQTARRRAVSGVVRRVAEHLGNTPAVCRASYIDPRVVDRFEHTQTIAPSLARLHDAASLDEQGLRCAVDRAVVQLLEEPGTGSSGQRAA